MRSTRTPKTRILNIAAAIAAVSIAAPTHGELLQLTDGRFLAGQILEKASGDLQLQTGSLSGPRIDSIPRGRVLRVYRRLEEMQRIQQSRDVARLKRWAAAYYYAELEVPATECVRRAWQLDPANAEDPLSRGEVAFREFWNRLILNERVGAAKSEASDLLEHARWAKRAELRDESAFYLRRAWSTDRTLQPILDSAGDWGIDLESSTNIDLRPIFRAPLITEFIIDQGLPVTAESGKSFLFVPVHYELRKGPWVLSKDSVRGRAKRDFYGIHVLRGVPTASRLFSFRGAAIFERVELQTTGRGRFVLEIRNTLGPRIKELGESKREPLRDRGMTVRASGWLLVIMEVSNRRKDLTFAWNDGAVETIDLSFLREAGGPVFDKRKRDPDGPEIARSLVLLDRPSPAMAQLSIDQLAKTRDLLPPRALEHWSERVEPKILLAGIRLEDQVRSAAWDYFASGMRVLPPALACLEAAESSVKSKWVDIIRFHNSDKRSANPVVGARLLGAILKSEDSDVCDAALDALFSLPTEIDWALIGAASETAQLAALDRIYLLPRAQGVRMLVMLMKSVRPSAAKKIAENARLVNLRITDPGDPILTQWPSFSDPTDRKALLTVLASVDLGDLVYSQPFAAIIEEVMLKGVEDDVTSAALAALVAQIRRRLDRPRLAEAGHGARGNFPNLVATECNDATVRGLSEAARFAPRALLLDALSVLLLEGFAEEAEAALLGAVESSEELNAVLDSLMKIENVGHCDGMLALLGRLLHPDHAASAELILSHLGRVSIRMASERWRFHAAVKAGVDFGALDVLAVTLPRPLAHTAIRWLQELAHLSKQDRQRLAASREPAIRRSRLERADLSRARLVDGQYGVLAVIETTVFRTDEASAEDRGRTKPVNRWHAPIRRTVVLPPLTLRSSVADNAYRVFRDERAIGRGFSRSHSRSLRNPAAFSPRLQNPHPAFTGPDGWGWPDDSYPVEPDKVSHGPMILPGNRPVREQPTADMMTLEIADYLRDGLRRAGIFGDEDVEALVPSPYKITLRYASFGSYYGVGVTRHLPWDDYFIGRRHLLNVMLVLERKDRSIVRE